MVLNDKDYMEIASMIDEGNGGLDYEKDGEMLHIDYTFDVDGYFEDDRENGTGAFVETARRLSVDTAETTDIDGRISKVPVDEIRLERLIA